MAKLPGTRGVLRALFGGGSRAAPNPAAPPAPPAARPDPAELRARLEALAAAARTRDYFEVLGLPRTCSGEEARRAAEALADEVAHDFAEVAEDPSLTLTLAPLIADVRQVLLDARDVLGDDASRTAYRQGLGPEEAPGVANGDRES